MYMKETTTTTLRSSTNKATMHSFMVFPEDLNYAGTLFGGKVLAEMDRAAAKAARRLLYGTPCDGSVTVSLDKVDFQSPAHLGDFIELTATVKKLGRTSMDIHVYVSKEDATGAVSKICEGTFVFVALKDGIPFPHNCFFTTN
jgi:acyl-CoA hydrolase